MLSPIATEIWAEFAVAMLVMLARFATRLKLVGLKGMDGTDLFCAIATCMYTILSVIDYLLSTGRYPTINELDDKTALLVPDDEEHKYITGSKMVHFSWVIYICMIFSFKATLLFFFKKVGTGIWRQDLLVKYTSIFVGLSWTASILAHLCSCVPAHLAWQVKPHPGPLCTTRPQNYYVAGVLNVITDAILLVIPVPMLWKLKVSLRRKLALSCLLCSGVFIMCCTILRTYYVFSDSLLQSTGVAWAGREGVVSMVVIATPGLWSLFRQLEHKMPSNKSAKQVWQGTLDIVTFGQRRQRSGGVNEDGFSLASHVPEDERKLGSSCSTGQRTYNGERHSQSNTDGDIERGALQSVSTHDVTAVNARVLDRSNQ